MKRKKSLFAAVALGLAAMLAACSPAAVAPPAADSTEPKWGGDLVVATAFDVATYQGNYVSDSQAPYINMNIFSKLVNYDDPTKTLFGDLATEWSASDDGLQYTFELRDDVTWHDGEPFSADDVVWTYSDLLSRGQQVYTYPYISSIKEVTATSPTEVVFTLNQPNASFLMQLADYFAPVILPKHIYEGTDPLTNPANMEPIGTGPFTFAEHVPGDRTVLERNDDYFGGPAYLDRVIFRIFTNRATAIAAVRSGEVGYSAVSPAFAEAEVLGKTPGVKVDAVPSQIFQWFAFNLKHPILSNKDVRHAIAMAVDTEQLNDVVYSGLATPASTMFLSSSPFTDPTATQPAFDLDAANELLDEAGYPRDADGNRFSLRYTAWNTSIFGGAELAQVLREQLAEVGIQLTIEVNDFSLFSERIYKQHDFDLNSTGGLHGPDPSTLEAFYLSTSGRNQMQYDNPEVDSLFAAARAELDEDARMKIYSEIQQILADDLPRVNLVEYSYLKPYREEVQNLWWSKSATEEHVGQDQYFRTWLSTGSDASPAS